MAAGDAGGSKVNFSLSALLDSMVEVSNSRSPFLERFAADGRLSAAKLTGRLVCADDAETAALLRHLPRHVELTRAEAGCLHFDVEPTEDPRVWTVSGLFVDQAAFDAHQARVRTSEWGQATSGIARDCVIETVDR